MLHEDSENKVQVFATKRTSIEEELSSLNFKIDKLIGEITRKQKLTKSIRCSFCNKSQSEVRSIIAGPLVYICNECIALCQDILSEEQKETKEIVNEP